MAITPVDFNIMQRSMDVAQIKYNEDMKPMVEQENMVFQADKDIHTRMEQVVKSVKSDKAETKFDPREEGKNFYFSGENRHRKKKEAQEEGSVLVKENTGFDMKI